ncbi:MAG: relaxase domain-containing protein [Actinobacteria bacterium]|nr:relaxase domain-containing protein [Actinomycetota bacterium]
MSLHRLSAGAGYRYLLRHTACGDVERDPSKPLTAYYTDDGYPPGRWLGSGLAGLGAPGTDGVQAGSAVTEDAMTAVFGAGCDPVTGEALGRPYPRFRSLRERVASRIAALPEGMTADARAAAERAIRDAESARPTRVAIAGFDLTFTAPKSASVLWALADPKTQARIVDAHRSAVTEALGVLEERALFTRVGQRGCAQVATRGMIAAAFDHWDTRTSDPNLHTHVVIANKVQGPDGGWRSVDSRALHHAVVAVSEIYDNLLADQLSRDSGVRWSWRPRGPRRTPAFEIDGIDDPLLREFSARAAQIDTALQTALVDFHAAHGRGPTRVETMQLRQQVTRSTRPAKTARPLVELLREWRDRALALTGHSPDRLTASALPRDRRRRSTPRPLHSDDVSDGLVDRLADASVASVMARRSTWTRWNLLADAARTTRGLRMATPADRHALHDRVVTAALARCLALDPGELFTTPPDYRRPDGSSAFTRPGEDAFTHPQVLDAEARLLDATADLAGPTTSAATAHRIATTPQPSRQKGGAPVRLARDQVDAVVTIATSGRRLDVLVGPAGTGKTTTLRALREAWESAHGRGSVIGLAPSATAAHELGTALQVSCENTAKWLHETTGPGALQRAATLDGLTVRRHDAILSGDLRTVRNIDAASRTLVREQRRWSLRPGQLLIVDEASLAGTLTLDTLTSQATAAGAKVLLVGDHRQLSAVDAGGAFGLLAGTGASSELRSLWRFRHRWEANASRLLRDGDPSVLEQYDTHKRIQDGDADTMLEAAYTAWQNHQSAGESALLLAADAHTVAALNTRAHEDRVAAGLVAPTGVCGADGVILSVGDLVLTRRNNRALALPDGGHVRNGALWTVRDTHPDGGLTLRPAAATGAGGDSAAVEVVLPADYVRQHVELGYAATVHRAQGVTVDHAHVLATSGMTREALYVAMTRGRDTNHAYVTTDAVDPDCDGVPDAAAVATGHEVLAKILTSAGAEKSATETLRACHDKATSLATLDPIRATLTADADTRRWQQVLPTTGLAPDQVDTVFRSAACGPLLAALRVGEQEGHDMTRTLTALIRTRSLVSLDDPVEDLAAVLHERVTQWLGERPPASARAVTPRTHRATSMSEDAASAAIAELEDLIDARVHVLTTAAIDHQPAWMRPLATAVDPEQVASWREAIATVVAYRDLNAITATTVLGPDTGGDDQARQARRRAAFAARDAHRLSTPDNGAVSR